MFLCLMVFQEFESSGVRGQSDVWKISKVLYVFCWDIRLFHNRVRNFLQTGINLFSFNVILEDVTWVSNGRNPDGFNNH